MVERLGRSGKYLVWSLSGDRYLLLHLRMTGTLLYDPRRRAAAHARAASSSTTATRSCTSTRAGSAPATCVHGADGPRRLPAVSDSGSSRSRPSSPPSICATLARGRTAPVKAFVLDQRRIAGVGNIYADEALFRAGIHPLRPAGRLTSGATGSGFGRESRRR